MSTIEPSATDLGAATRERASGRHGRYWSVSDLVMVGTFAALAKVAGLLIVLFGGGMNPVTLMASSIVSTALLLVLLHKVQRLGTLTIFLLVSAVVDILVLGGNPVRIPASLLAGVLAEGVIWLLGGYRRMFGLIIGVAVHELLARAISLGVGALLVREEPRLLLMVAAVVVVSYIGSLLGLWLGRRFIEELRHAGIIHH
ncbi:MptD family putative ECF transporter S component [Halorhodospira sp. 9621]|uniref:MptD family putative ECF transporter S component n=1 Tax=Halorhodospira TaxID=85108 RepID=UPI0019121430|nr:MULTISPECIES: MptD family putative ECF transporter S component [Halorhodospira]MBK5937116.1 hypothetical protein [Halorhodospira halophila]MCG5533913.1 MptD family putative ECF transporter S component [Halorhodospira sp. 9621]MCG5539039.1 MptD family putative ECF transporter S component [Halorhodospira sp. 9622]